MPGRAAIREVPALRMSPIEDMFPLDAGWNLKRKTNIYMHGHMICEKKSRLNTSRCKGVKQVREQRKQRSGSLSKRKNMHA